MSGGVATMYEQLIEYFLTKPRRLIDFGGACVSVAAILVVSGLLGHAETTSISVMKGLASASAPRIELANVFPGYWTWWVPESVLGFCAALVLGVVGFAALHYGRKLERFLKW